jgi:predicted lipoprotein with Yx(FWY)xxD motif
MQKQRLVALAIGLTAILAACSSSGSSTAPSAAAATAAPSTAASAPAASAPAAGGATIALADSSLGKKIIVDENGMTLYMFTPDDGQAAPTCATGCIDKWPALIATSPTAGAGLDASKLSTVARADGLGTQVKYGDYFLYHFANDKAAGDINGQGLATKWYVLGADGEPIKQ